MKIIYHNNEKENAVFAEKAANYLRENPRCYTYAESYPEPGKLFAIRWNSFTVLVIRLAEDFEPLCYPTRQFFPDDLPPLKGDPCIPNK